MGFFYGCRMIETIKLQLSAPLFEGFSEMEAAVLSGEKPLNQMTTLELSLRCQNMSQVFALAYRCALQHLLPQLDVTQWAAMCVTEENGNHPKKIEAFIEGNLLSGEKSFVTMASYATQLLVIAKDASETEAIKLKAVLLDSRQPTVEITTFPALGLMDHVPHGKVRFNQAQSTVLEGDGYELYSKPFRTFEDTFILLGSSAFILSMAYRYKLDVIVIQKAMSMISQLVSLPIHHDAWMHVHLDYVHTRFFDLIQSFESQKEKLPQTVMDEWLKDKKIFSIAGKAREIRFSKACQALFPWSN